MKPQAPKPQHTLTAKQARRMALTAQGFADPKPRGEPKRAHIQKVLDRVGLVQIDSVNVLSRSHYLPFFARLGPYAHKILDDAAWGKRKLVFEYWGHEASMIPMAYQPLLRWRMEEARQGKGMWPGLNRLAKERRPYIDRILKEIASRGALGAGELSEGGKGAGGWWGWSDGKRAVEWLFWAGYITTATRRSFERVYDLTERVIPGEILDIPTPTRADAQRELISIAARSMGVATMQDLRDYFRMGVEDTKARVAELVEAGELTPVEVKEWDRPAFLAPDAKPKRVETAALLSPFDSLVWRRERAERLFGFRYRIEIYTPAHKREHGYYVLPFLMGEAIGGRLDLKADRKAGKLLVKSAHAEPWFEPDTIAEQLAPELAAMAGWLGLDEVKIEGRQTLAKELKRRV